MLLLSHRERRKKYLASGEFYLRAYSIVVQLLVYASEPKVAGLILYVFGLFFSLRFSTYSVFAYKIY